jgi:hypothetical protein
MKKYKSVRISRSIFSLSLYFVICPTYEERVKDRKDKERRQEERERKNPLSRGLRQFYGVRIHKPSLKMGF